MERRPGMDAPRAVPALPAPVAAALALGTALVLGAAGEAAAQTGVCAGDPPPSGSRILCNLGSIANDIDIDARNVAISVTTSTTFQPAVDARATGGAGNIVIRLGQGLDVTTSGGASQIGSYNQHQGAGDISIVMEDGASIATVSRFAHGINAIIDGGGSGDVTYRMTGGSITTSGNGASGIILQQHNEGAVTAGMSGGSVRVTGSVASGIRASGIYLYSEGAGAVTATFSGGSIEKSGGGGAGITFDGEAASTADVSIRVTGGSITAEGATAYGVHVDHYGTGGGDVAMTGGSITTAGALSHGVFALLRNAANEAEIVIGMAGGSVTTEGAVSVGLYAIHQGLGSVTMTMEGEAEVTTSGDGAHGVSAFLSNAANEAEIVVGMAGGSVATEGLASPGLRGFHSGLGSVTVTTGGEASIEAPFAIGVEGQLVNGANAAGRLVVTHGGAVEARDVGVLAWAARRSGHTSGDGAEEADDAARAAPMIHVTSSGDVTVGVQVRDAFIRNRIAGDDGTLSAGERAVLDAIAAGDSDALTTALESLPADYDDDWKAEAENLRRKRAGLTSDVVLANRAAEGILGLTRAGVRALALSHVAITGHVRTGDGDGALSAAERTALEAALTGRGLDAALAALPAAYTDAWKDTLRAHAASYNEGDVRVDVTGGTITAEGDGVDARYALAHDRNGAIAVSVAEGASVTGGRHGVHVGGAGLAAGGGLRAQTVTVNGEVMGGTGAGVHLAGGGTVTVGRTGRVGAASGVGILSDGAGDLSVTVEREGEITGDVRAQDGGDLSATVAGTVEGDLRAMDGGDLDATISGKVEGDLLAQGGGALMLDVQEGGTVTGTVHDPAGPLTVAGSIGRLLYGNGGTVTVAATGRLTGVEVEGGTEAVRSEAGDLAVTVADMGTVTGDLRALGGGDLTATISGTVEGDLRAMGGGALTVDVQEGGAVIGTVHDPADPFTVTGSIGRLVYASGGTVTVAGSGRLTGVEVEGGREAIRSEAGDLAVTVAEMGTVTGNVRGLGAGALSAVVAGTVTGDVVEEGAGGLDATISGTVEGNVFGRGTGEHTVTVSNGGTVRGAIHLAASTVTVHGTAGRVQLDEGGTVTVGGTGRITGIEGIGLRSDAGALAATVSGTVEGDVLGRGTGEHTVAVSDGGTVTGTVDLGAGTATVHGTAGRVQFDEGGAVTVGETGRVTGIEGIGLRSDAGALAATVSGTVGGDVRARGGVLTLEAPEGGVIGGTVYDPAGPFTFRGSIGRLLYANGGTVTVAGSGRLTGVEAEGGREAIRSEAGDLAVTVARTASVTGDLRGLGAGGLSVMVAGTVTGDVVEEGAGGLDANISGTVEGNVFGRGTGGHTVTVSNGGTVRGAVHLAAGTVTVHGTAGRVQLDEGGTVTVGGTGRVTGIEGIGLRSDAGALAATVSGTVEGDVLGRGAGAHTVAVSSGGTVTGTVHLGAGTVTVHGTAGRVQLDEGGTVTVGETGRVTGIEGIGLRSDAGALAATVSGTVEGDVLGRGAGAHTVAVSNGGTVTGTVHLGAGTVTVHGTAGRVQFDEGGTVTVGETGRITGIEGDAVYNERGDLKVTLHGRADETPPKAGERINGAIRSLRGGVEFCYVPAGGAGGCAAAGGPGGSGPTVAQGAFDVGLRDEGNGVYRVESGYAPRTRVYEALPSALLGMNGLMRFEERMAAPRADRGGWARAEVSRGQWKADASTTEGLGYGHRRYGLRAGLDVPAKESGLFGVSLHHRQGSVDVSDGGWIEFSGVGAGVSGAWFGNGVWMDFQAEVTRYEAALDSVSRGTLNKRVPARGHALGAEAGRRFVVDAVPGGAVLTPRAGLVHSKVSVSGFPDAVGSRVSLEDGRSLKGRMGVSVEAKPDTGARSRVSGSLDVEHEFSDGRKVRVSGTELTPVPEATWFRFGLNGSHASDDGRWTLAGGMSYATSGGSYEFGGGVNLKVRF